MDDPFTEPDWRDASARTLKLQGAALQRMKRAYDRGTGCTLSAEMLAALACSTIGEWWENVAEDGSSTL